MPELRELLLAGVMVALSVKDEPGLRETEILSSAIFEMLPTTVTVYDALSVEKASRYAVMVAVPADLPVTTP